MWDMLCYLVEALAGTQTTARGNSNSAVVIRFSDLISLEILESSESRQTSGLTHEMDLPGMYEVCMRYPVLIHTHALVLFQ